MIFKKKSFEAGYEINVNQAWKYESTYRVLWINKIPYYNMYTYYWLLISHDWKVNFARVAIPFQSKFSERLIILAEISSTYFADQWVDPFIIVSWHITMELHINKYNFAIQALLSSEQIIWLSLIKMNDKNFTFCACGTFFRKISHKIYNYNTTGLNQNTCCECLPKYLAERKLNGDEMRIYAVNICWFRFTHSRKFPSFLDLFSSLFFGEYFILN